MDELTGIFDNLDPDDFNDPITVKATRGERDNYGAEAFDQFIDRKIETVRESYLASEGQINPVATLASRTSEWMFTPTDEETLGQYVERLRSEAKRLGATWLFISRKTLVGSSQQDEDSVVDTSDPEQLQAGIEAGLVSEGVFFFAERIEDGVRDHRHGIMKAENSDTLGELVMGNPVQTVSFFATILGG